MFEAQEDEYELRIPLPDGVKLCAILKRRSSPLISGIVIICHGRLAHKDATPTGELAKKLPFDTLRWDMRGAGESDGITGYMNYEEEAQDLAHLINYLQYDEPLTRSSDPKNKILALLGHSKGACVIGYYASTCPSPVCRLFINLSGRYRTEPNTDEGRFSSEQMEQLRAQGKFVWMRYRVGKDRQGRKDYVVTREAYEAHQKMDMTAMLLGLKSRGEVLKFLTIHGKRDQTVPPLNAKLYDKTISSAPSCSSDLIFLDGAGHQWKREGDAHLLSALITAWVQNKTGEGFVKAEGEDGDILRKR